MTRIVLRTVLMLGGLLVVALSLASALFLATALGGPIVVLVVGAISVVGAVGYLVMLWDWPLTREPLAPEVATCLGSGALSHLVARWSHPLKPEPPR